MFSDTFFEASNASLLLFPIIKFSKDLFYSSKKSDVIIQPRGTNEIIRVIQAIQSSKFKIAVRGGGLSYSAGYLAERENTVLLDMRLCDQIIQINADDMFAIVGAGTTSGGAGSVVHYQIQILSLIGLSG